ncbi:MAG: helix-turn-helix domain-containing protein [Haloarculaceae archaeon]
MSTGIEFEEHHDGSLRIGQREVLLDVSELFGRKWNALILYHLSQGAMGFSDLKSKIKGISGKMLAESLEMLTDGYGVVTRHEISDQPKRVEYSLSPTGEALAPVLFALHDWGSEHLEPDNDE